MRQAGSTRKDCDVQTCSIPLTKRISEAHPVGWGRGIGISLRAIYNVIRQRTMLHQPFDEKQRRFDKNTCSIRIRNLGIQSFVIPPGSRVEWFGL